MGFGLRQPFPHAVGVLEGVLLAVEREGKSSEQVLEHMSQGQTILAYQKGCGRMREADVFCGGRKVIHKIPMPIPNEPETA